MNSLENLHDSGKTTSWMKMYLVSKMVMFQPAMLFLGGYRGVWMAEMWIGKGLLRLLLQANHIEEIERPYLYNGMWFNNHSNKYIISIHVYIIYIYILYIRIYIYTTKIYVEITPPHQFSSVFLRASASVPGFVAVLHPPPLTPWQAIPRSSRWWR